MSETKYSFKAVVTHAQIGELKGCAKIAAEQFPEFKQKNLVDDDPEKKKRRAARYYGLQTAGAVAFLRSGGKSDANARRNGKGCGSGGKSAISFARWKAAAIYARGIRKRANDSFVRRSDRKTTEVLRGPVQSAFWSPDDSRIAFMRFVEPAWTVWTMACWFTGQGGAIEYKREHGRGADACTAGWTCTRCWRPTIQSCISLRRRVRQRRSRFGMCTATDLK